MVGSLPWFTAATRFPPSQQDHNRSYPRPQATDSVPFRFMDLPTELRLQIYRHLLVRRIQITHPNFPTKLHRSETRHPAILRCSHKIYGEALIILYSENTLQLERDHLTELTTPKHHHQRRWVKSLSVSYDCIFLSSSGGLFGDGVRNLGVGYPALQHLTVHAEDLFAEPSLAFVARVAETVSRRSAKGEKAPRLKVHGVFFGTFLEEGMKRVLYERTVASMARDLERMSTALFDISLDSILLCVRVGGDCTGEALRDFTCPGWGFEVLLGKGSLTELEWVEKP